MSEGIKTILYPVTDLAAAKALYGGLAAAEPIADAEYYVGWRIDGQDIGLVPNGHQTGKLTATVKDADGNVIGLVQNP
jgi:hypothetical protein